MGLLDRYVNTLTDDTMGPYAMTEEDRKKLKKRGLLQFGLNLLANPTGQGGVFQAFGKAAAGAAQDVQQGGQDMLKSRYQADLMTQKKAEFEKQKLIDGLAVKYKRPDGTFDMQGYEAEYRALAPDKFMSAGGNNELQSYDRYLADLKSPDPRVRAAAEQQLYLAPKPIAAPYTSNVTDVNGTPTTLVTDRRTGQVAPASANPAPTGQVPMPVNSAAVQDAFKNTAMRHNFSISSAQRPVLNIGAGANSQHPKGTAVDYSVKGKTKEEGDALIADLRAQKFEVVDERYSNTGTGPHIHAELPSGYSPNASAPITGRRKEDEARAVKQAEADVDLANKPKIDAAVITATESAKSSSSKKEGAKATIAAVDDLLGSIQQLKGSGGFDSLGTVSGDLASVVPFIRNDTKDAQQTLDTVAGQVALATMAQLKALSSSGSTGFGSMTAPELNLLQNSITALKSGNLSNKQLKENVAIIEEKMMKIREEAEKNIAGGNSAPSGAGGLTIEQIRAKYRKN